MQPTTVFLSGEFHGERSWWATVMGSQRVGHDWAKNTVNPFPLPSVHCFSPALVDERNLSEKTRLRGLASL